MQLPRCYHLVLHLSGHLHGGSDIGLFVSLCVSVGPRGSETRCERGSEPRQVPSQCPGARHPRSAHFPPFHPKFNTRSYARLRDIELAENSETWRTRENLKTLTRGVTVPMRLRLGTRGLIRFPPPLASSFSGHQQF